MVYGSPTYKTTELETQDDITLGSSMYTSKLRVPEAQITIRLFKYVDELIGEYHIPDERQ